MQDKSATEAERRSAAAALAAWWADSGVEADLPDIAPAPAARAPAALQARSPSPARAAAPLDAAIAESRARAAACADVAALSAAIAAFELCPLRATARGAVTFAGPAEAPFLVIGDAPGREDDAAGAPFAGEAGRLLERMLAAIGIDRARETLSTNAVFWRPPGDRPATEAERAICLPFLERLIALARPKMLILLGPVPAKSLLRREEPISRLRGRRLSYQPAGGGAGAVNALVTLHPAYLLKRPLEKKLAWADLQKLDAWVRDMGAGGAG